MKKIEKIPLRITMKKKGDVVYIPARLSACTWALLIVITKAMFCYVHVLQSPEAKGR